MSHPYHPFFSSFSVYSFDYCFYIDVQMFHQILVVCREIHPVGVLILYESDERLKKNIYIEILYNSCGITPSFDPSLSRVQTHDTARYLYSVTSLGAEYEDSRE